jgi:hypothetical protein
MTVSSWPAIGPFSGHRHHHTADLQAMNSIIDTDPPERPRISRGAVLEPVTNQVTSTSGHGRRSSTHSDTDIRLACVIGPNATPSDETGRHGMQEVRGSNPLSSTIFRILVRLKGTNQVTTVPDFRAGAHLSEGRRIGPDDAGGRIRPGRQGKSFSGSLGPASRSPAGMRSLQEVTRLLATVRRPVTRRDVWPDRFRAISAQSRRSACERDRSDRAITGCSARSPVRCRWL